MSKTIEFIDLLNCSGTGKFTEVPERKKLDHAGNVEYQPAIYHTVHITPGWYGKRKAGMFSCTEEVAKLVMESKPFLNKTIILKPEGETVPGHNKETERREAANLVIVNSLGLSEELSAKIEEVKKVDPKSVDVIVENIEKVCERILTNAKKDTKKNKE